MTKSRQVKPKAAPIPHAMPPNKAYAGRTLDRYEKAEHKKLHTTPTPRQTRTNHSQHAPPRPKVCSHPTRRPRTHGYPHLQLPGTPCAQQTAAGVIKTLLRVYDQTQAPAGTVSAH
jgi:hypothetical protein